MMDVMTKVGSGLKFGIAGCIINTFPDGVVL